MDRSIVKQLEKEKNSNFNEENFVAMFIYWGTIIYNIMKVVTLILSIHGLCYTPYHDHLWSISEAKITGAKHILIIWVTWQVSNKRQELLTLHTHPLPVFDGVSVVRFLVFCVLFLICLSSSYVLLITLHLSNVYYLQYSFVVL